MSRPARLVVMLLALPAVAAFLGWGMAGLHPYGRAVTPYALAIDAAAPAERHVSNIVASVVYDYRAYDSLGEEMILFAAVSGVALLLRERRGRRSRSRSRSVEATDLVRFGTLVWIALSAVYGLYLMANGHLSPGGGFQGGVALMAGFVLFYLAAGARRLDRLAPTAVAEALEAAGALGFVAIGCGGIGAGSLFLYNWLPSGTFGSLASGGVIPLISVSVGVEVAGGFVLLLSEFAQQLEE